MNRFNPAGALLAILSAGPVFLLFSELLASLERAPSADPASGFILGPFILILFSVAIGAVAAILPVVAGGWAMQRIGRRHRWARGALPWALAGAALGWPVAIVMDKGFAFPLVTAFIATGAICALIVRGSVGWADGHG